MRRSTISASLWRAGTTFPCRRGSQLARTFAGRIRIEARKLIILDGRETVADHQQIGGVVKRYLERAKEIRTIAEEMKDPKSRETLIRVAEGYERMAAKALSQQPPSKH